MKTYKPTRKLNKTSFDVIQERDRKEAILNGFGGSATHARMRWDLNDEAKENLIFELKVGKERILLHAEEVRRFLRWV